MTTLSHATPVPASRRRWAGRIVSGIPVLFLLFDAGIKLARIGPVEESFARLGYPAAIAPSIGALELACVAVYLVPRTAVLGAVLLTGFLGGAIATHVRVGDPLLSHVLFPAYVATLIWAGTFLRDGRVRALLAPRSAAPGPSRPTRARTADLGEAGSAGR
jgi:hypothetical protein